MEPTPKWHSRGNALCRIGMEEFPDQIKGDWSDSFILRIHSSTKKKPFPILNKTDNDQTKSEGDLMLYQHIACTWQLIYAFLQQHKQTKWRENMNVSDSITVIMEQLGSQKHRQKSPLKQWRIKSSHFEAQWTCINKRIELKIALLRTSKMLNDVDDLKDVADVKMSHPKSMFQASKM